VKDALKLLRASLPSTIDIRRHLQIKRPGADVADVLMADPTQIHQVLMNLGINAGNAMREEGGVLEVTLSEVDMAVKEAALIPVLQPGPYLKLTVSDTGHGIDPAILNRIFDPYFSPRSR
jgi:signal transduction histidine kinase